METFVAVLHIVTALILIALVLVQDTKSGSLGGAFGGGGGSNSLLGAGGGATLAQKMTRWTAVVFACTSIGLTVFASRAHKSVVDSLPPSAPVEQAAPVETAPPAAAPEQAPATTETK